MRLDGLVDLEELAVVDVLAARRKALADDVRALLRHELLEERNGGMAEEVAAVLGGIADDLVHLVELLARDEVRDERRLVERLVIRGLGLHTDLDHALEGELDAGLDHRDHEHAVVEVLLLGDLHGARGRALEGRVVRGRAPAEEVLVAVVPVGHHRGTEGARDDVVLVLAEQRAHERAKLVGELEGLELGGVRKAVHHQRDAALLERLGDGFPAVLHELRRVPRLDSLGDHAVEAEDGARLQHAAEDRLLAHEVALHFGNEARLEDTRAIAARGRGVGLGDLETVAVRVVLSVHGDERRHPEATLVFFTDLGARALRRDHDDRQILADLLTLLDDVEAVAVGERGAGLHERHDLLDHVRVLLVRCEVAYEVRRRDELLVGANLEAVRRRVRVACTLFRDGVGAERVADVEPRVAHVEALIEALRAAAHDDDLRPAELLDACKFAARHDPAAPELVELLSHGERVEIVLSGVYCDHIDIIIAHILTTIHTCVLLKSQMISHITHAKPSSHLANINA